jgi:hypothetical protein
MLTPDSIFAVFRLRRFQRSFWFYQAYCFYAALAGFWRTAAELAAIGRPRRLIRHVVEAIDATFMPAGVSPVGNSAERISVADRFSQSGLWHGLKIIQQITQGSL